MAVFEVREGHIVAAWFHPGHIADDEAFWGEVRPACLTRMVQTLLKGRGPDYGAQVG